MSDRTPPTPGSGFSSEAARPKNKAFRVPVRRMRDEKLLFEINRRVLHPLGYALAIVVPEEGSKQVAGKFYLLETDDPEGYYMGKLDEADKAGLAAQEDRRKRYLALREALGYPDGVEPLDG